MKSLILKKNNIKDVTNLEKKRASGLLADALVGQLGGKILRVIKSKLLFMEQNEEFRRNFDQMDIIELATTKELSRISISSS